MIPEVPFASRLGERSTITPRLALLVDGDNLGPKHASRLLSEAEKLGRVDVRRVYAAASCPSEWRTAPGFRFVHSGVGKNAADLLLCIDAMELALSEGIEAFVIASSDGDFTHLALRLRERGLAVVGAGEAKAPVAFRQACTAFVALPGGAPKSAVPDAAPKPTDLDRKIRKVISEHSQVGRGMRLVELAPKMHSAHGTKIGSHPDRNWRTYLSRRPALYDIDPRGPDAMVRFRPAGFGSG
jgi:uncharacterized LabA/DUF88 family protein